MATALARLPRSVIFLCDVQEKFRHAIFQFDKVVLTSRKVLRAAHVLDLPVYVTTQNRARLGNTVPELSDLLMGGDRAGAQAAGKAYAAVDTDKTLFSMWTPEVRAALGGAVAAGGAAAAAAGSTDHHASPASVAIVGIESHICITQTALDLLAAGHRVYVLADGVSSCNREEVPVALARLRAAGATVTTSESWLYEVVGNAAIPQFRSIVGLVKDTSADTKTSLSSLLSPASSSSSSSKI